VVGDISTGGDLVVGGDFHNHSVSVGQNISNLTNDQLVVELTHRSRTLRNLRRRRHHKLAVGIVITAVLVAAAVVAYTLTDGPTIVALLSGGSAILTFVSSVNRYGTDSTNERRQRDTIQYIRGIQVDRGVRR
jgi:hypothetical protein